MWWLVLVTAVAPFVVVFAVAGLAWLVALAFERPPPDPLPRARARWR